MSQIILTKKDSSTVANAAAGKAVFYVNNDGTPQIKNESGTIVNLGTSFNAIETTSTSYTVSNEDVLVLNPSTSGSVNIGTAAGRSKPLYLMNKSNFQISITGTINGSTSNEFLAGNPYAGLVLLPTGGNWYVF